jgi:dihydroneopterin aldolase
MPRQEFPDVLFDAYAVRLRAIRFQARFGVTRGERAAPQDVLVDVDLELPVSSLPARDRVEDVISYDQVACIVVEVGTAKPHRLLETYAAEVVKRLLADTPAKTARVAVTKVRVPTTYPVGAAIVELFGRR